MSARSQTALHHLRLGVVYACLAAAAGLLLWRLVDLHVMRKDFLRSEGDARHLRVVSIPAHRGMITDRYGEPLAVSTPVESIWAHPQQLLAAPEHLPTIAELLGMPIERLARLLHERRQREFVYLRRQVDPALAARVMSVAAPGVSLQREYRRYYPTGEVAAHVLGFANIDDIGQEGVELAYDRWLRGTPGSKRVIRDRIGRVVENVESLSDPRPGKDLTLTIDRRIQYLAYRELKAAVQQHRAVSGSAVILDARTGEVLAMVNQPAYNPNNRQELVGERYRNRAVTDLFEPGSTIKPFTVAAAMESGVVRPDTVIDTRPGHLRVGRTNTIRDIRNYGQITPATILQKSSNVGAGKIALAMEPEVQWRTLARVGFGQVTDLAYPGEAGGLLVNHPRWSDIERVTLSFGYGLSVTALQLAQAYTVFATDGRLLRASLVRGDTIQREPSARVLGVETAYQVRQMLEAAVLDGGTATRAAVPGYRVAGKTGTVKQVGPGGYSDDKHVALFAGFAPATDPRLVMAVVINEPRGRDYYGGAVAAPVFGRVMTGALRLLDVAPDDMPFLERGGAVLSAARSVP